MFLNRVFYNTLMKIIKIITNIFYKTNNVKIQYKNNNLMC